MRGQIIRGDGLAVSNGFTTAGASQILLAAFQNQVVPIWLTLCRGTFSQGLTIESIIEPNQVNGFARQDLTTSEASWPIIDDVDGSAYVESKLVTFNPTGAGFDTEVNRVALVANEAENIGDVYSMGQPFPEMITMTPDTPLLQRQFRYRIYL